MNEKSTKIICDYDKNDDAYHAIPSKNINAYLIDAPDIFLENRKEPICNIPAMRFGSMPRDGGNLIVTSEQYLECIGKDERIVKFLRSYVGAEEFINNKKRWCLWLHDVDPSVYRNIPIVMQRIEATKKFRLASTAASTRKFAKIPSSFCQIAQPSTNYLIVPGVSSERRYYVPIGFMEPETIANNLVFVIPEATLYHFSVIQSSMHMAWTRTICGRIKSDYRYSNTIVYNNFSWPENPSEKQTQTIEAAAQAVLDARAQFPESSLADLYDPLTMPPVLLKAHQALDKAVDAAYGKTNFKTEAERVVFLFELYQKYTSLLPVEKVKKRRAEKI